MLRFDQIIGSDGVLPTAIVGIHCHLLRHHCYSSAIVRFPLFRSVEWNHPPSSIFSLIPVLSQLTRRIYITLHDCIRANFLLDFPSVASQRLATVASTPTQPTLTYYCCMHYYITLPFSNEYWVITYYPEWFRRMNFNHYLLTQVSTIRITFDTLISVAWLWGATLLG